MVSDEKKLQVNVLDEEKYTSVKKALDFIGYDETIQKTNYVFIKSDRTFSTVYPGIITTSEMQKQLPDTFQKKVILLLLVNQMKKISPGMLKIS